MRRRLVVVLVVAGTVARGVAGAGAGGFALVDPNLEETNRPPEETNALQVLQTDPLTAEIADWIDRSTRPPEDPDDALAICVLPCLDAPQQPRRELLVIGLALAIQALEITSPMAELWWPLEAEYLEATPSEREAIIVAFVRNNRSVLDRIMRETEAIDSQIQQLEEEMDL